MKQVQLNGALQQAGFQIDENGFLAKYTIYGRRRKNWKNSHRQRSRQFLKEFCEICGANYSEKQLTIHHKIPLREAIIITEENCQTLCRDCHDELEQKINASIHVKRKVKIISPSPEKSKLSPLQQANRGKKVLSNGWFKGLWGEYRME